MTNETKPALGGSYLRDPDTGELTLVEKTMTEAEAEEAAAAEAAPAKKSKKADTDPAAEGSAT